ncbi:MAG: glycosyltransferase family 4 protein [Clostridium sp.]
MKIYFLTLDIFGMGGTIRTVLNVANYLADQNYEVEIISVLRYRKENFFKINPKIRVVVLHDMVKRAKQPKTIKGKISKKLSSLNSKLIHKDDEGLKHFSLLTDIKMKQYLNSIKSGVLISTRPSFNIVSAKYVNKNVIKIGQEHLNLSIYPRTLQRDIKAYYPKLDYLATLTNDDTEDYKKLFQDTDLKIVKLTNSLPIFEGRKSTLDNKTIIAAGRLVPQKGFDMLIEACEEIVEKAPDWRIKIFGSGPDKQMLTEMIQEKRLYNNVILMGPTQDMEEELCKSSIYALSSRFEGFGMVIIEAMQCGVPVVSFDCPKGPSEIIENNVDGILVENGDVKGFSKGLLELINNDEKRKSMGEKGLENVARYSIEEIGKLWIDLLNEINYKNDKNRRYIANGQDASI